MLVFVQKGNSENIWYLLRGPIPAFVFVIFFFVCIVFVCFVGFLRIGDFFLVLLKSSQGVACCLTELSALGSLVIGRFAEGNVGAGANRSLGTIATVESLGGNDAVDLCDIVST